MSFNFGQFRQNQTKEYMSALSYTETDNSFQKKITLQAGSQLKGLDSNGRPRCYFLELKLYTGQAEAMIVKMINNEKEDVKEVVLYTDYLMQGDELSYTTTKIIINPKDIYNEIVIENPNGGSINRVDVISFGEIYNILNTIGHTQLKQIGVQGPAGMLMAINGEPIRIGRTGIYEINYGIPINFIGLPDLQDSEELYKNQVIIDYQY